MHTKQNYKYCIYSICISEQKEKGSDISQQISKEINN